MPDVYLWTRHVLIHMHMFACAPFYFEEMLILVYSLMDSDERASLKKTMFWIKQRLSILHEHVVQCFTCNACCILQVLCIQKKEISMRFISCDISLQTCGGWAGSSQNCGCRILSFTLPTPNFVSHPFLPQFCGGREDPMFGSITKVGCPPVKTSMDDFEWMKLWT